MTEWSDVVGRLRWQDILDVAILTFIGFRVYLWLRGTVALQVLAGMSVVVGAAIAASRLGMVLTGYLLQAAGAVAALVAVVVFQTEIRRALRRVDPFRWWRWRRAGADEGRQRRVTVLAEALVGLAERRIGALIVLPRADEVAEHLTGGQRVDSRLSSEMIEAIFHEGSPIHDGAVVIRGGRIDLAGAFLPLSTSANLPAKYGTRHRAAAGLSESCDAVVIAVSEERGEITLMSHGEPTRVRRDAEAIAAAIDEALREREGEQVGRAATVAVEREPERRRWRVIDGVALLVILAAVSGAWYLLAADQATLIAQQRPVELRNVPQGREVTVLDPRSGEISIRLRGPRRLLYSRAREEISAWVDLRGVEPGATRLPVRASAPPGLEVVGTEPPTVRVRIEEKQKR